MSSEPQGGLASNLLANIENRVESMASMYPDNGRLWRRDLTEILQSVAIDAITAERTRLKVCKDRNQCAYCKVTFKSHELLLDHWVYWHHSYVCPNRIRDFKSRLDAKAPATNTGEVQ